MGNPKGTEGQKAQKAQRSTPVMNRLKVNRQSVASSLLLLSEAEHSPQEKVTRPPPPKTNKQNSKMLRCTSIRFRMTGVLLPY